MTDALKMAREALKPCPHCGLAHTLELTTAQELAEEGEDDPEPWMQSDSWAVICDASRPSGPGGCGASGGFYPSEAEAVEAWNRRAAIDAQQAATPPAVQAPLTDAEVLRVFNGPGLSPADRFKLHAALFTRIWRLCESVHRIGAAAQGGEHG